VARARGAGFSCIRVVLVPLYYEQFGPYRLD